MRRELGTESLSSISHFDLASRADGAAMAPLRKSKQTHWVETGNLDFRSPCCSFSSHHKRSCYNHPRYQSHQGKTRRRGVECSTVARAYSLPYLASTDACAWASKDYLAKKSFMYAHSVLVRRKGQRDVIALLDVISNKSAWDLVLQGWWLPVTDSAALHRPTMLSSAHLQISENSTLAPKAQSHGVLDSPA